MTKLHHIETLSLRRILSLHMSEVRSLSIVIRNIYITIMTGINPSGTYLPHGKVLHRGNCARLIARQKRFFRLVMNLTLSPLSLSFSPGHSLSLFGRLFPPKRGGVERRGPSGVSVGVSERSPHYIFHHYNKCTGLPNFICTSQVVKSVGYQLQFRFFLR